jgi:hypothetical protein
VDGFVHAESGEIIVLDVRPFPKLSDGHPLLQQVRPPPPPASRCPARAVPAAGNAGPAALA